MRWGVAGRVRRERPAQAGRALGLVRRGCCSFLEGGDPLGTRKAVAGYDLIFTPVKSISVMWALGDPRIRREIEAAHHEGVAETIAWLERHAAFTWVGAGEPAQVETRGLVCAASTTIGSDPARGKPWSTPHSPAGERPR